MTVEILTGALVLITGFYAWVTFRIMKANERTVSVMGEQIESVKLDVSTIVPIHGKPVPWTDSSKLFRP